MISAASEKTAKAAIIRAASLDWRVAGLEMDESGKDIGEYFQGFLGKGIERFRLREDLFNKKEIAYRIKHKLGGAKRKTLAVYGNGEFHHYTYGLCKLADSLSRKYCYIHIDHHDDYWHEYSVDKINCGSFVGEILQDTHAQSAFFIGSRPDDSRNQRVNYITKTGKGNALMSLERVLDNTPNDVYLSFDLDVMANTEILTEFSRGTMKANQLLKKILAIKRKKRIISADILGYVMHPCDNIPRCSQEKSRQLYLRIAEAVLSDK